MNTPQGVETDYREIEAREFPPTHEEPEATVASSTASVDDYVEPATRQDETPDFPEEIPIFTKTSTTSSSSSTSSAESRPVAISLSDYRLPQINYDRDSDSQKLVAVIGREFDEPRRIAVELQAVTPSEVDRRNAARMKFVPFVVRRSVLIKSNFDWQELKKYDLICMCYNASEARILLTGRDGFYTALLHNVEIYIGKGHSATHTMYVCMCVCQFVLCFSVTFIIRSVERSCSCWM